MFDGAELGEALAANPGDVEAALLAYENKLFPRSADSAEESGRNMKMFFDDNAPQGILELFSNFNAGK